jgi:hypothetical protein
MIQAAGSLFPDRGTIGPLGALRDYLMSIHEAFRHNVLPRLARLDQGDSMPWSMIQLSSARETNSGPLTISSTKRR